MAFQRGSPAACAAVAEVAIGRGGGEREGCEESTADMDTDNDKKQKQEKGT